MKFQLNSILLFCDPFSIPFKQTNLLSRWIWTKNWILWKRLQIASLCGFFNRICKLINFWKKIFSHLTKNFFIFFSKFQEMPKNPIVPRVYRIQFFVQFCTISEKFRKSNCFDIKMNKFAAIWRKWYTFLSKMI